MDIAHLIELANNSGGTLYLMLVLLLVALTVIVERSRHLASLGRAGADIVRLLQGSVEGAGDALQGLRRKHPHLPHLALLRAAQQAEGTGGRNALGSHLEEALMHEVPRLDRSLWVLDTIVTLAPLLGLFGTIIGMFNAFKVLADQSAAVEVTGGIAEALVATGFGLLIAMIGLVFLNALGNRVRLLVHQLETLKVMIINRADLGKRAAVSGFEPALSGSERTGV
jgi:biopolymer transport protein ExbB